MRQSPRQSRTHARTQASMQSSLRSTGLLAALAFALGCSDEGDPSGPSIPNGDSIVVVAVGDMVCGTATPASYDCVHAETATLAASLRPNAVFALGDLQYETGSLADFGAFYHPTWGLLKQITYPVAGNHEYSTPGAAGYFDYFNGAGADSGRAGHRARGWYSVTLGDWLVIALNSNCGFVGGCGAGSPQEVWLRNVLAQSTHRCAVAIMHHPRFSSGSHGSTLAMQPFWEALYESGVDLVLAGHEHAYERFAPLAPDGTLDSENGIRSFVAGMGGKESGTYQNRIANSDRQLSDVFGVLKLVLHEDRYTWEFVPVPGEIGSDSGAGACR